MPDYLKPNPEWEEHEKPSLPGSPGMPWHPPHVRLSYAMVGLLLGITGGLSNALVSANLPILQGQLGLTPAEGAWLPAAYVMVNVTANLIIYKCRQQFGMRLFAEIALGVYAVLALLHLAVGTFETTILVRAASGWSGAACSTLTMLYMLQALPRQYVGKMLVVGVGVSQLAVPIAWLISPLLLHNGTWHNLYLFEAGLALCAFAAVVILKLPTGMHIRVLEKRDFLTFALIAPAVAMIVAVIAQGYVRWWFDTPWLAWLLIGGIVLLAIALFIEHHRSNPLVQTRWLMMGTTIRFLLGAFIIRFLTSEQTYGVVGLLRILGMGPDQMQALFGVVLAGTIVGIAASALSFSPRTILPQILAAICLFAVAGALDYGRTSLDRPHDFYFSQFLVAVGAGMFVGPLIMIGFMQALKRGADHVVTFTVGFAMTQSLGGLAGAAALSSYQLYREHEYSSAIVAQVSRSDPQVALRLRQQAQVYGAVITDPVLRNAQGVAALGQAARREANVRAYNDVYALSATIALLFLIWSFILTIRAIRQQKNEPPTPSPTPAAASRPAS